MSAPEVIVVACASCGQRYKVGGKHLGLRLKCQKCGASFPARRDPDKEEGPAPRPGHEDLARENETLRTRVRELEGAAGGDSASVQASIDGLDAMTLRIGADGVVHYVNSALAGYLKLAKADLVGKEDGVLRRVMPPELWQAVSARTEGAEARVATVADGQGRTMEVKTICKDGVLDVVLQDVTEKHRFRQYIQRYVSADLASLPEEDLRTFKYPERRFMTVSFTDLRGFTALSESLRPEEVRMTINAYLEEIIRAIDENHASVDKIVGDQVMALYGAPRYFADHAVRAVKTACEQMLNLKALQRSFSRFGKTMPDCGIGINTGDMVVGNMGSVKRQDYTVVGAAVNLAARLCGAARGSEIILTEATLQAFLQAMPREWESREDVSGENEGPLEREKAESVLPLPDGLRGKVVSVGPGVRADPAACEYRFQYLHALRVKGINRPIPIVAVSRPAHARSRLTLDDTTLASQGSERIFGRYRLLEFIGKGGMGEVWKARDGFGNILVIKTLLAGEGASEKQLQRFRREAKVMAKLFHRGICRIQEVGEVDKQTYIAMEHVEGVSLAEVLAWRDPAGDPDPRSPVPELGQVVAGVQRDKARRAKEAAAGKKVAAKPGMEAEYHRALPSSQALPLMLRICDAVQFAHSRGILHRDLKPANIMVRATEDPVVMDFGLAKMDADEDVSRSMSWSGQIVGTIEYMAPEQAEASQAVDERADIYSLGAVLYQMLTGTKHFQSSGNLLSDAVRLKEHTPRSPREISRAVDQDLANIVLKALRAEPAERYRSVAELKADLEHYREGSAVSARAESPRKVLLRLARRHKGVTATVAASLLLFVLGVVAWGVSLERERSKAVADKVAAQLAQVETQKALDALKEEQLRVDHSRQVAAQADDRILKANRSVAEMEAQVAVREADLVLREQALAREKAETLAREKAAQEQLAAALAREKAAATAARQAASGAEAARRQADQVERERYGDLLVRARAEQERGAAADARRTLAGARRDLRGWEWGHLVWRARHPGDPARVAAKAVEPRAEVRVSAAGRAVLVQEKARVAVHDPAGGAPPCLLEGLHDGAVAAADISPDGRSLLTAGADHKGQLRSLEGPEAPVVDLPGHAAAVSQARFSPCGRYAVTASNDNTVRVWSGRDGRPLAILRHPGWPKDFVFSPDGGRLLTWAGKTAFWWDLVANAQVADLSGHDFSVTCGAVSPDGRLLATGGMDRKVVVWDAAKGTERRTFVACRKGVLRLTFSTKGDALLVTDQDRRSWVLDTAGGNVLLEQAADPEQAAWPLFDADGDRALLPGPGGKALLAAVRGGRKPVEIPVNRSWALAALAFTPEGHPVAAWADGTVAVRDAEGGQELLRLSSGDKRITRLLFTPDGRNLLACGERLSVWPAEDLGVDPQAGDGAEGR